MIPSPCHAQRLCDDRCDFWRGSVSQKENLTKLVTKLEHAARLSVDVALSRRDAPEDHILEFMSRFDADARALSPGDFLVRPGGWRRRSGGHVVLFVVARSAPDAFSLTVCNTGGGTQCEQVAQLQ